MFACSRIKVISAITFFCLFASSNTKCEAQEYSEDAVIVKNRDIEQSEVAKVVPLYYRSVIDPSLIVNVDEKNDIWAIPVELVIAGAEQDKNVLSLAKSRSTSINGLNTSDVVEQMKLNASYEIEKINRMTRNSGNIVGFMSNRQINYKNTQIDREKIYEILMNLEGSKIEVSGDLKNETDKAKRVTMLKINSEYAKALKGYSEAVDRTKESRAGSHSTPFQIYNYSARVRKASSLKLSQNSLAGEVTFGKPIAYHAKEMGLKIPPSLQKTYDIYWLELAFTPMPKESSNFENITFSIQLEDRRAIALELVPLEFGTKVKDESKVSTPEIEIDTKIGTVSIGEFFSKRVEYEYIKPTVSAVGLREPIFGWIMRDKMTERGAKRFVCILGTAKGTKSIDLEMAVSGTLRASRIWHGSKDVASTDPQKIKLDLPR